MASTNNVLDHHLKCFGESDLGGILADYSRNAVLFMPSGPLKGIDAIGLATALALGRARHTVFATMRNPDRATQLRETVEKEKLPVSILTLDSPA